MTLLQGKLEKELPANTKASRQRPRPQSVAVAVRARSKPKPTVVGKY